MLTREQIIENINAMEKQGATQADIQAYLDTIKTQQKTSTEQASREISAGEEADKFLQKPWYQQLFSKQVAKEIPGATTDVLLGTPAKFLASTAEVPETIIKGQASQRTYNIPGIKPFKSYQSEAETRANEFLEGAEWTNPFTGKKTERPLWTLATPFVSVPLAGIQTAATIQTGVKIAQKGLSKAGEMLKSGGEKAYRVGIPMEETTKIRLQKYQAEKPTLFERVGNYVKGKQTTTPIKPITEAETAARTLKGGQTEWQLGVNAKRVQGELWNDVIDPALKSQTGKVNMKDFFTSIRNAIYETPDLSRRNSLLEALDAIMDDYKNVSNVSWSKLQDYKSGWAEFIPERAYQGKPIAGALNEVRNAMAEQARQMIYSKLGQDVRQAYLDYGNLESIAKAGRKSVDLLRSKGITKQVWEFLIDKAITPVSNFFGKMMYVSGDGLKWVGDKGAGTLRDLLMTNIKATGVSNIVNQVLPK